MTFNEFCRAYKRLEANGGVYSWSGLDKALITLCQTNPRHVSRDDVYAKVRIINRAYLANLQFGVRGAEWEVAKKLVKEKADTMMAPLHQCSCFSVQTLPIVLGVHEKLVKLTHRVTKKLQNSFVSKYLHFHFPNAVPIFDKKAYEASWKLAPAKSQLAKYDGCLNCDFCYHSHSILRIMNMLRKRRVNSPSLKLIDVLLYDPSEGEV